MVREYVGARYVPKFMGGWSATTEYEPLSIVDDGLGTSYTSKKPVPAGTPLTDTEYWAVTGSTSGAIVSLQNRVSALEGDVSVLNGKNMQTFSGIKNIRDFGAVGDGSTDDSAAIQAALAGGGCIYIPVGSFAMNNNVLLDSNTTILCDGEIIDNWNPSGLSTQTGLFDATSKTDITIEGVIIKGSGAGGTGIAISYKELFSFNNCANIRVEKCKIYDTNAYFCIRFNACDTCNAFDNYIENYSYCGIGNVQGSDKLNITRNVVLNCKNYDANNTYPITINSYEITPVSGMHMGTDLICTDNYIYNDHPHWESIDAHGGINVVISGNICEHVYDGITVFTDPTRYFYAENVEVANNIVICDNTATQRSVASYGITFGSKGGSCHDNVIINGGYGTTAATAGAGIYAQRCEEVTIHHNNIRNAYKFGILVYAANDVMIEDNIISGVRVTNPASNGIGIYFATSNYGDVSIKHNRIHDCDVGFIQYPTVSTGDNIPHIRSIDNIYDDFDSSTAALVNAKLIRSNSLSYGISDVAFISPVVGADAQGQKGDIIRNINPAAGDTLGWICLTSKTASTGATWRMLPTL